MLRRASKRTKIWLYDTQSPYECMNCATHEGCSMICDISELDGECGPCEWAVLKWFNIRGIRQIVCVVRYPPCDFHTCRNNLSNTYSIGLQAHSYLPGSVHAPSQISLGPWPLRCCRSQGRGLSIIDSLRHCEYNSAPTGNNDWLWVIPSIPDVRLTLCIRYTYYK